MTKRRYRIPSRQQVRVLQALLRYRDQGSHGYDLMKATALSPATLYGLLKRLHDEGYLSKLEQTVDGRCRLCYTLTRVGLHYAERTLLEDEYGRGATGKFGALMSDPARAPHAALLFGVARRIVPNHERMWLDDMKLEYAFVPGRAERLRWLFGVVGFALRLRAATFGNLKPSQRLWLASLVSVLFVAVVVSPVATRPPTTKMSVQPDVSQESQFGGTFEHDAETDAATTPKAGEPSALAPTRAARAAAPLPSSSAALPTEPPAEDRVVSETAASKTADALTDTVPVGTSRADAARDGGATASDTAATDTPAVGPMTDPSALARAPTVGTVAKVPVAAPLITAVTSDTVTLRLTGAVWLELRQGGANGPLLQKGTFEAGKTFDISVPFYLATPDAGGVSAWAGAENLRRLGNAGEAQTRLFVRP